MAAYRATLRPQVIEAVPADTARAAKAAFKKGTTVMRLRDLSPEGREAYGLWARVESTLSQGVRAFGMHRARYRGEAKTHLQEMLAATAINVTRATCWLAGEHPEATKLARFAALVLTA